MTFYLVSQSFFIIVNMLIISMIILLKELLMVTSSPKPRAPTPRSSLKSAILFRLCRFVSWVVKEWKGQCLRQQKSACPPCTQHQQHIMVHQQHTLIPTNHHQTQASIASKLTQITNGDTFRTADIFSGRQPRLNCDKPLFLKGCALIRFTNYFSCNERVRQGPVAWTSIWPQNEIMSGILNELNRVSLWVQDSVNDS